MLFMECIIRSIIILLNLFCLFVMFIDVRVRIIVHVIYYDFRLFTPDQVDKLHETTLRDIILEISAIEDDELAGNPFFHLTSK